MDKQWNVLKFVSKVNFEIIGILLDRFVLLLNKKKTFQIFILIN